MYLVKTIRGETLEAGPAFALLAGFMILSNNVAAYCVAAVIYLMEFRATIKRTQDILSMEEMSSSSVHPLFGFSDKVLKMEGVSVGWSTAAVSPQYESLGEQDSSFLGLKESPQADTAAVLQGLNFSVEKGELIGVVGRVGSGKTTLLHAILGECPVSGSIYKREGLTVAYVEQEPYILADTIQKNILFGLPLQEEKLKDAIRFSRLTSEVRSLPEGLNTLVGEKGVTLSGGQRARISLARAIYAKADLYLLDDPLSAVDLPIASSLMEDCIRGKLKGKTRMLVTHRVSLLRDADKILWLGEGKMQFFGSY